MREPATTSRTLRLHVLSNSIHGRIFLALPHAAAPRQCIDVSVRDLLLSCRHVGSLRMYNCHHVARVKTAAWVEHPSDGSAMRTGSGARSSAPAVTRLMPCSCSV